MGGRISKIESSSNVVGTAGLHAELATLFGAICGLAPELAPPSDIDSVSLTITPALDLNPAHSNCAKTLALVLGYFWYNVYAPLFYLALVKHRVDFDSDDGDDRESMTMLAPALVDGSPFKDISAAELPEEIRKGLGLLLTGLRERKYTLEEELISVQKWKRSWSATSSVLSVALVVINLTALVAATVPPAAIAGVPLASVAAINLLGASVKAVDPWLGMMADERKSKLESQADAINAMHGGGSSALLLLPPTLEQIRSLVENLKIERAAATEQNTMATNDQMAITATHLEREVEERKKKVEKGIKSVRKTVDCVERQVKKKAVDFANFIAK
uniref:Uncharacterized protein n=1 Tax=Ananas comosus var. bracteatus TaxID=296719 RepID=A0A6V7PQP6_ANACO|nr:unnamed protein product [Ananas comosus var. bracteatus]